MKKSLKKGFTIVELVIVIAVIGILAAVLIPTFSGLINESHLKADSFMVRNINERLEMEESLHGKNETMYEALLDAQKAGYIVANINAQSKGNELVWDQSLDRFALISTADGSVIAGEVKNPNKKINLWKIKSEYEAGEYSIYLKDGYHGDASIENVSTGLDVGENTNISNISYVGGESKQSVVIRTNSAYTSLTINAPLDTVNHYDTLGALNIIESATASYHENGKVAFAEIAKGRIVLESGSEIAQIHINANASKTGFGEVIIADNGTQELPSIITRDEVTVTTATLVVKVESNGSSESVYVYADGASGSTQKITEGENKQNENVNSVLGQLVLDNGSESKALSQDIKEAEKTTSVQEAVTKEVEQEIDEDEYALYEARIGRKGYVSLRKALNEAKSGETVVLLKDADLVSEYALTKSITIYGSNHSVRSSSATGGYGSSREGRVFDISNVSNLNISLVNIRIIGENNGVRGISLYGTTNVNLVLSDCSVTANYYAINVASANTGLHVTLKNNTFSTGWCAIQSWSPNAVFDILGGTLEGINNKAAGSSNSFSTIVFNGSATNNTWNFKNVTIKASTESTNKQTLISNRTTGTKINFDNCTFFSNGNELTDLQDIYNDFDLQVDSSFSQFIVNGQEYDSSEVVYSEQNEDINVIVGLLNELECEYLNYRIYINSSSKYYARYSTLNFKS